MGRREDVIRGEIVGPDGQAAWSWTAARAPRSRLPFLGIFLVVLGALLLLRSAYPELEEAGSLVFLAAGLALLVSWAVNRGSFALHAGAVMTALAAPGVLTVLGLPAGEGIGTLALGVAFLFVALVRAASGAGLGWQGVLGLVLLLLGGLTAAVPGLGDVVFPLAVLALGVLLVAGAARR